MHEVTRDNVTVSNLIIYSFAVFKKKNYDKRRIVSNNIWCLEWWNETFSLLNTEIQQSTDSIVRKKSAYCFTVFLINPSGFNMCLI